MEQTPHNRYRARTAPWPASKPKGLSADADLHWQMLGPGSGRDSAFMPGECRACKEIADAA